MEDDMGRTVIEANRENKEEEIPFGKIYYTNLAIKEKEYKYINYIYLFLYLLLTILLSGVLWAAVEMLFLE